MNGQASARQARHRKLRDRQPLAYTGVGSGVRECRSIFKERFCESVVMLLVSRSPEFASLQVCHFAGGVDGFGLRVGKRQKMTQKGFEVLGL